MACEDIQTKINNLTQLRLIVVADLHTVIDPRERARLIQELKLIGQQISIERIKLEMCLEEAGGHFPLTTLMIATYNLTTTDARAPGPFNGNIELGILFNATRTQVSITSFPDIVTMPFDTPLGINVTTVTKI